MVNGNVDGTEAVLIGCNDGNENGLEKIFKIFWQGDGLRWGTLDQELKYPRNHAVAMIIPDSMTECTRKSKVQTSLMIPIHAVSIMNLSEYIKTT